MTLEQERAALAFGHIQQVDTAHDPGTPERSQYGTLAGKLPALIQAAGLCQAIHFVRSRRKKEANRPDMALLLLGHLAQQLHRVVPSITDGNALCREVREAPMASYLWLSREAVACATWYARLAKSELGVELTDEAADGAGT